MSNDISLTQALGGLRIANPDNSPGAPSPLTADSQNPPRSSHSSASTVTPANARQSQLTDLGAEPYRGAAPAAPVNRTPPRSVPKQDATGYLPGPNDYSNRIGHVPSMPMASAAQPAQYPAAPVINQPRSYGPVTGRAIQGIYNQSNASGGSQTSSYSAYRYGDEPPHPIVPPNRSSSRAMASGVIAPQSSRGPEYAAANNNLPPPRRSSRRISPASSAPTTPGAMVASTSYMETTPLHSSEEWKEKGAAIGVRREIDSEGRTVTKVMKKGVKDFEFGRSLGEGSYSTVVAATDRSTLREYAIKILDKRHIIKEKKVKYVNIEKDTLNRLNDHPGIVRLFYTFQDERSLYFVLDLAINGELLGVLKKTGTFDEECTRFYGAQILDAVDYMHHKGVLHRDLKPENVLLDSNMHVKITDFGTGKMLDSKPRENGTDPLFSKEEHRAVSFVGTAEYVSPELLTAKEGGKPTDLWAFGCIIYQLLCGRPPFKGATEYLTFDKILKLDYTFPPGFPPAARDLVERLLVPDPSKRLTVEHVKNHPFFDGIKWGRGLWKQPAPRLKPYVPPAEPIRLNSGPTASTPATMALNPTTSQSRPHTARLITELPAPSQLDIEWSPVLTRQNERILKLGNLVVTVSPQPHNPHAKNAESSSQEAPRKFSRFFMSGNTTKKRQRLVMITSSARIIIAASGGDEKKAKMEISLLGQGTTWRSFKDNKGLTSWCVDTREKHILFEPPPSPLPEPDGTAIAAREWMDALARARELAITQQSLTGSYSGDSTLELASSQMPSPAGSTLGPPAGPAVVALTATAGGDMNHPHLLHHTAHVPAPSASHNPTAFYASSAVAADGVTIDGVNVPMGARATINMRGAAPAPAVVPADDQAEPDGARSKGRKRFSRRQSKGGLAAVF